MITNNQGATILMFKQGTGQKITIKAAYRLPLK